LTIVLPHEDCSDAILRFGGFGIAANDKIVALDALCLLPTSGSALSIRMISSLGDDALMPDCSEAMEHTKRGTRE
jgi:hypothetical protein